MLFGNCHVTFDYIATRDKDYSKQCIKADNIVMKLTDNIAAPEHVEDTVAVTVADAVRGVGVESSAAVMTSV